VLTSWEKKEKKSEIFLLDFTGSFGTIDHTGFDMSFRETSTKIQIVKDFDANLSRNDFEHLYIHTFIFSSLQMQA
jgi:hypothetical protein